MPALARFRMSPRSWFAVGVGCVLLTLLGLLVFSIHNSGDYNVAAPVGGDNTGPGITALLHGSIAGYVSHQPVVGLTSIVLRFPFVAVASALGAGDLATYQVGALACILPLAMFGAWLVTAPGLSRKQRLLRLSALLLVIQSPILRNEIAVGHPEGTVAYVLGVLAVLAAMKGRPGWAGLLLGLAIGAKETGMIAVPPVMIALSERRVRAAAIAGGVVLLVCGSSWLADPPAFLRALHGEGSTHFLTPFSVLWPVATPIHLGNHLSVARHMPVGLTRTRATVLVLMAASGAFTWWYLRARQRGAVCNPVALLVLVGLMRCVCDSTHETYYWISVLVPMAAWEALENRIPIGTALVSAVVSVMFGSLGHAPGVALYVGAAIGVILLATYLGRRAMPVPERAAPVRARRMLDSSVEPAEAAAG